MVLTVFLVGCSTRVKERQFAKEPTVQIPDFSVSVKLSEKARIQIHDLREWVAVRVYFDGDGQREPGIDTSPMRAVVLGSEEREVNGDLVAEFKGLAAPASAWDRLSDENFFVTINTVSAGRSARDNILDCDDPEKRINEIKGKEIEVNCELLIERYGQPEPPK
jgi:hypothetical protein